MILSIRKQRPVLNCEGFVSIFFFTVVKVLHRQSGPDSWKVPPCLSEILS